MEAAYDHVIGTIAPGLPDHAGCDNEGGGHGSWSRNTGTRGNYACYNTVSDGVRMWWIDDELAILSLATDQEMSVNQIWRWFIETNTGPR
jgi:hypothetical protein